MIDFTEKFYKNDNGTEYIRNGEAVNGYEIRKTPVSVEELENLYHSYKYSIPSESEEKRKNYFKALSIDELSTEALFAGINRTVAREKLELAVLEGVLNGSLTWDKFPGAGTWFWQSKNDPDMVILKEWIEGKPDREVKTSQNRFFYKGYPCDVFSDGERYFGYVGVPENHTFSGVRLEKSLFPVNKTTLVSYSGERDIFSKHPAGDNLWWLGFVKEKKEINNKQVIRDMCRSLVNALDLS